MKLFLLFIFILLAVANALAQELGIPAESEEYNFYNSCVSGCSLCETRCQDSALQQYAENNQQASICDQITDEALKDACSDNINSALAIAAKDVSKCSTITEDELKNGCELVIVQQEAVNTGNANACSKLNEQYKAMCIKNVDRAIAIKNNDKSYCKPLPKQEQLDCLIQFSENAGIENPEETRQPEAALLTKFRWNLIIWVGGGIALLGLLAMGTYFLTKRKSKISEPPLIFKQQIQPSQMVGNFKPLQSQQPNMQDALKKVSP